MINILKVPLTNDEIQKIKTIIDTKNNCESTISINFNTIWFYDGEVELRLNFLSKLIVSRVNFTNKRQEIMSEILKVLKDICNKYNIEEICIQSVLTKEMQNFCNKNGFVPDSYTILNDDVLCGDYLLKIKD